MTDLTSKLNSYYITAVLGVVFAIVGFSYNAWRMEVTEDNSNIRTAAFSVLSELAELEQIIYAAHYDKDAVAGSPRKGWVKIGLISDLSMLISEPVSLASERLKSIWSYHWEDIANDLEATDKTIAEIDKVRAEIKLTLKSLD